MSSYLLRSYFNTTETLDIFNATHDVKRALRESGAQAALLTVYLPAACGGVVILENDTAIHRQFGEFMVNLFPAEGEGGRPLRRSKTGSAPHHLRASLFPNFATIPVHEGKLLLGPWQEVIVYDFDNRVGRREVLVHVFGEEQKKGK